MKAYLGLGGNIGDPRETIRAAIERIRSLGIVEAVSLFYKTEPVGYANQPWFINCALLLETELPPEALLAEAKRIERELGREPTVLNGPRAVDIDILLYGDFVLSTESLALPHPRFHERRFVLAPLSDIAPRAFHPVLGKTVSELLAQLNDAHACEKLLH